MKKKPRVLFLDCDDLLNYINLNKRNYKFYSFKNIQLLNLFKSFQLKDLTITKFKENYFKEIIKKYKPDIVVGHDINLRAVQAKKLFPNIITITYQFSFLRNESRFKKLNIKKKLSTDYFICFSKFDFKIVNKYFKAKFIISGSLRNNMANKQNLKKKANMLNYISEYSENIKNKNYEKKILLILKNFCLKNKYLLNISLRSKRSDKSMNKENEINFYKAILGDNFKTLDYDNYSIGEKSLVNICKKSNLGFELIARNKKVIFLPNNKQFIKDKNLYFKKNKSEILETSGEYKKINYKLKRLIKCSSKNFKIIVDKSIHKIPYKKNCFTKLLKDIKNH